MSGGSQERQTTTQTQTSSIPDYLEPYAQQSLDEAQRLYEQGGPQAYPGSTVIPFSQQTQSAMNNAMRMSNYAQNYSYRPYEAAGQQIGNMMPLARGDFSGDAISQNALTQLNAASPLARGDYGKDQIAANHIYQSRRLDPLASGNFGRDPIAANAMNQARSMTALAQGDFENAPQAFKDNLALSQEDAAHQINDAMSSAGRYGSAVHQGEVGRRITQATNDAKLNYQRFADQSRANALGMAGNRQAWADNARNTALNMAANRQAWADQSRRASLGDIAGRQMFANDQLQRYSSMLPINYQTMMQPTQTQMGIGGMYEDLAQRMLQDRIRVYNDQQNREYDNLARYNAHLAGAGLLGRDSTQSSTVATPRNYGSVFGNALTGAVTGGPIGGVAGALSGLFG